MSDDIKVLTAGEAEVIKYLEKAGVPDFGIETMLDGAQDNPGRWPMGSWVDETSNDEVMVTVSFQNGVFRVESGSAEEFFADADDEEQGEG